MMTAPVSDNYRRYLRWFFCLFASGCLAVAGVNRLIDPFNLSGNPVVNLPQEKLAEHANDRLARLTKFANGSQRVVVLGDSRAKNLTEWQFQQQGLAVSNLAYGGGTLYEAIDTFWYATRVR